MDLSGKPPAEHLSFAIDALIKRTVQIFPKAMPEIDLDLFVTYAEVVFSVVRPLGAQLPDLQVPSPQQSAFGYLKNAT
jgi:hypothetical protein